MKRFWLFLLLLIAWPVWALEVVATTASMGMLARTVGGTQVRVTELVPPDRDAHMVQVRPSMIRALRDADLVVAVGAELEVGWLPAALASAANRAVLPGQPGYFEAAAHVSLLDVGLPADRALGDTHPAGNPHINLDPTRMARVAEALAERLGQLDPTHAAVYRERADAFARAVAQRLPSWRERVQGSRLVSYHRDVIYLADALSCEYLGAIEPVPGVAPTAGQIQALAERLKGKRGLIASAPYQPSAPGKRLAELTGWKIATLPLDPEAGSSAEGYFALIERWVQALADSR